MKTNFEIQNYFNYIESQLNGITAISTDEPHPKFGRKVKKILILTLLDTIAKTYCPSEGNKTKVTKLIRAFGRWPECERVSLPQLCYYLERKPKSASPEFIEEVKAKLLQWGSGGLIPLEEDPELTELESIAQSQDELLLASRFTHLNLLYIYRNHLIHEFRQPGYGIEFPNEKQPYYHSENATPGGSVKTWELVYPVGFFESIARNGAIVKSGVRPDQAASLLASVLSLLTSAPSLNFTPLMTLAR